MRVEDGPERRTSGIEIVAVRGSRVERRPDRLVGEEPMAIRAAGPGQDPVEVAVTMRTPGHEAELAVGFLRTESLIDGSPAQLHPASSPHVAEQPSPGATPASSQASLPRMSPSPQIPAHTDGEPAHM